ncbi:ThuA domain-containing protein [Erythrobacter sp. 3-20A1M]|uniref:ThuA domain-containing protein n=1 Tax=Erythrobacter sp. 3-20A1M TaxID=2653850 RepID=UPI00203F831A|nr:ThuA domain-containing protein [Erythrobacter sp. 3-20A1M]
MTVLQTIAVLLLLLGAPAAPDPHLPQPTYDEVAPELPEGRHDAVLIVSKTNGWRHIEHIPHSNAVLADIAAELGRQSYATENGAIFNDEQLGHFSVVVLNSASGDFLTREQEGAFSRFLARGGGIVALHAAGDDSHTGPWYVHSIIGTTFIGHPGGDDHIEPARIVPDRPDDPLLAGLTFPWTLADEWYSFDANPADNGMQVVASIDEDSYRPGEALAMGAHPVIWTNPRTPGRVVYSALGHTPEAYDDSNYRRFLANAIRWAAGATA